MRELKVLIKEYIGKEFDFSCVTVRRLGDIAAIKTGSKPEKIDEKDTGYEYINAGTTNSGYVQTYNCEGDVVTTPSRGEGGIGYVGYQKNKFWLGPLCYKIQVSDSTVLAKYLYYYLSAKPQLILQYKNSGGVPSVNVSGISKIEIEIPPIEIQEEIVRILDKFTELETELQAELEARKKQYEYCRNTLFTFEKNVEYKNILDVISMKARVGWQALTKKEYLREGEYYLITGTDFMEDGSIKFDGCVFVSEERFDMDENIKVYANDILMTKDGTLGKVAFLEVEPPKPATLNGGVYRLTVISEDVLPRYMYHYFKSHEFKCFVEKVKTGGTIKHLTQKWFETLKVPVPAIEVQRKIIKSLDAFNNLCYKNDIGLVAELEARHKQYEYYRDKLLTFERKVV